jgi:hypothetical protein
MPLLIRRASRHIRTLTLTSMRTMSITITITTMTTRTIMITGKALIQQRMCMFIPRLDECIA